MVMTMLGAAACGEAAATASSPTEVTAVDVRGADGPTPSPTQAGLPELALSFEPGDTPTERRIAAAQDAVREHATEPTAYVALAASLLKRRRETSNAVFATYAEDVLRSAASLSFEDPHDRAQIDLLSTMLLLEQHRFEDAAEKATGLTVVLPNDPTPLLLLGDAKLELGEYDLATDAYQEAMNLRPDLRSYNRAAHMRWLYGDFDGAKTIIDLAIDAGSARDPEGQAWCFADLGAMYLARGDARRAAAAAERALMLVPEYGPGTVLEAKTQAASGELSAAIETLSAAVERHPSVEDLLLLSEWLDQAQRPTDAQTRREQAERLVDDDPRPMAHYLARHGLRSTEALALAERELEARKNIAAHDTHALALLRNGRVMAASLAMERALALGTQDADLTLHAAMIQAAGGEHQRAQATLDRALKLNPDVDPRLVAELRTTLGAA